LQVTYLSGNTDVATVSGSTVHFVGAGTTVITASQAGNTLWNPAADVQQELTVNKADQTITFNPLPDKTYGDSDFTLTAVASSALQVTYLSGNTDVATISGSTVHIVGAGTTVITASQAGNDNFNAAPGVQQSLTVNKADQTITFEALLDKTFGTPDYNLFATASSGLAVTYVSSNTAVATVTGDLVHIAGVGTTLITASQAGSSNYNAAPDVPQTLNVYTANATITLGNLTTTYNGLAQTATATTTPSGLSYDITYDGSSTPPVNAGSYTVAASITDGSYHGSASGTMTIHKAPLTASADDKSRAYGEENPPLTISYTGFVASDDEDDIDTKPLAECAALPGSDVGTYPVTVSGGEDNNYSFTYVDGILTILKADQTIIFSSLPDKTFGDDDFYAVATATSGLAVTYTSSNTAVASITDGLIHIAGAGTTVITASQAGNALWNPAADVQQELTVNKADQTITFNPLPDKTYGDSDFTLTALAGSTLPVTYVSGNTDIVTVTGNTVHIVGAGTTVITASQAGNTDYNEAPAVPQALTVNKARLTFTADNKSRPYGEENPLLTYTISGFVNSETDAVLDQLPAIETTALESSPAGEYPLVLSGGSDNCYTYIYIPGVLTITSISQVITFVDVPSELLAGDSYTLAASSTSGLEVLFESLDNSIATITGNQLTGVSRGVVQIRAYNEGDLNYDPAEALTTIFINTTHKEIMHLFTPNNDGFNDYWELPEMATWGKCNVKVFNRWGKLVFSDPDYNIPWNGTSNGNPVPEGAYYFIIKTENEGVVKGTVNVVR
jgi:gliding motility-associated-like protein